MGITTTNNKASKNNFYSKGLLPVAGPSGVAMLLLSFHSGAADWTITPTLDLKETYTDNVRLARDNEKSDFVTQINPGITLIGTGPHLKVDTRYVMQNLFYVEDSGENATNHRLRANANAELVDDLFFVDAKGSITQQSISSFGQQTTDDNTNITNNRTNVKTYSISPYLLNHFQNFASSEVRYTHDSVSTTGTGSAVSSALANSQSDKIQMRLASGTDFRRLGWGLNYSKQSIDFDNGQNVDMESYGGNLRYLVTPHFSLTTTEGYEKNNYIATNGNSGGAYWTAGFEWNPSLRTSIAASAGRRFFGPTYSVKANHRSRRTVWNVSYSEDVTTTRSQFLLPATIDTESFLDQLLTTTISDPIARQQFVEAFIRDNNLPTSLADSVNFLTNRFFLQKRLQASVSFTGVRNIVVLSLFDTKREAQTSQTADSALLGLSDFSLSENINQVGINALWNRKISQLTSAHINAGYTRTTAPETGREDEFKTFRIGLTKQLQPRVNGTIELRHNELASNQSGSNEYKENSISALINIRF